ncbi:MAG: DUF4388 domain-containing protein [Cyanobacteriota/Melainabacteria group bacterium]
MFNRNRPQPPAKPKAGGTIKLPQLWSIPERDQISAMMQQAQKNNNVSIEQMWSVEGLDKMFVLNCLVDEEGDPLWILKETIIMDSKLLWEHRSRDIELVHSLVEGECQGEVAASQPGSGGLGAGNVSINIEHEGAAAAGTVPNQENSVKASAVLPMLHNEDAILQGDLTKIQITMVLQSIQMGKMTGRLAIRTESKGVDVYFDEGEPTHATDGVDKGNEVIFDLVCLQSGKFQFIPDERTVERSVTYRLDGLLMESISLVDQSNYLVKEGLKDSCYLISRALGMTEQDLTNTLSQGLPLDQNVQFDLLRYLGNYKQFSEMQTAKPLKRSEWVPILFNLVTLGIVSIAETPPQDSTHAAVVEEQIDYNSLAASLKPITRAETGILIYPALQYFLAQEIYRNQLCGIPVTLAVFSIKMHEVGKELTNLDIFDIMAQITEMKRPIDILGHFQTFEYALILPNMGSRAAANVVQKIQSAIPSVTFKSGINGANITIDFGIAGVPEHCTSMGQLIPAAAEARKRAESTSSNVMVYQS